jgi:hypothetical protein
LSFFASLPVLPSLAFALAACAALASAAVLFFQAGSASMSAIAAGAMIDKASLRRSAGTDDGGVKSG